MKVVKTSVGGTIKAIFSICMCTCMCVCMCICMGMCWCVCVSKYVCTMCIKRSLYYFKSYSLVHVHMLDFTRIFGGIFRAHGNGELFILLFYYCLYI